MPTPTKLPHGKSVRVLTVNHDAVPAEIFNNSDLVLVNQGREWEIGRMVETDLHGVSALFDWETSYGSEDAARRALLALLRS